VGAVFSLEASRLSRSGKDWHRLLAICAVNHYNALRLHLAIGYVTAAEGSPAVTPRSSPRVIANLNSLAKTEKLNDNP